MTGGQPDPEVIRRHLHAIEAELGVLPADFAARFRAIAGFRNVLVHGYLAVDLQVVEGVLRDHLPDFQQFVALIGRTLLRAGQ